MSHQLNFTHALLNWHNHINDRELPWKGIKDPYKIWLSEIILQQTRAQQGLPYYQSFIQEYPTILDLANAEDEHVFKLWQGLGYYSRCRNLLKAARIIRDSFQGIFPNTYKDIITLPGVGPYTAAAIASFAFGEAVAVLDGNVYRVLSRYLGILEPIDTTQAKKIYQSQAQQLLDYKEPALYNQAIMDLGATICKPTNPLCDNCPVQHSCYAYKHDMTEDLPIKSKKITVSHRYFNFFILTNDVGDIYMEQRKGKDIWQDLYQPFLIESEIAIEPEDIHKLMPNVNKTSIIYAGTINQKLTHRYIHSNFYHIINNEKIVTNSSNGQYFSKKVLKNLAIPKTIFSFLSKNNYF